MFKIRWKWIAQSFRMVGSLSVISLLTLLKRKDLFKRILSDTNRSFCEAWGQCLDSISPQELTGVYKEVNLILNRKRMTIGINDLIPLLELVKLSRARNILEIGTSSSTTWHLAANIDSEGAVTTVDLPPKTSDEKYSSSNLATERPTPLQLGRYFLETPESFRIKQILIDSTSLKEQIRDEKFDLIFIDAAHTYEYVKKDTKTALLLINNGGYLVWHDYFVFHPDFGVRCYLNELAREMPIYRFSNSISAVSRVRF